MKTTKEYYLSLDKELRKKILIKSFEILIEEGPDKCLDCVPTTPYGGCYVVDGQCVWIPEFGK